MTSLTKLQPFNGLTWSPVGCQCNFVWLQTQHVTKHMLSNVCIDPRGDFVKILKVTDLWLMNEDLFQDITSSSLDSASDFWLFSWTQLVLLAWLNIGLGCWSALWAMCQMEVVQQDYTTQLLKLLKNSTVTV